MAKKQQTKGIDNIRFRHGDTDSHDLCLYTRKTSRILLENLSSLWGEKDGGQEHLALFLLYNKHSFSFLSVDARLAEDGTPALIFQSAEKVGCAPLYSPVSGKVCASIIVKGSMGEDISEIIPLIEEEIEVQFSDKLILPYKSIIKPPLYFECAKYVDQYILAQRLHWQKFVSEVKVERVPSSSTQWSKYAVKSYDPEEILKYPNKRNLLSTNHTEWRELNYVLKLSLDELSSPETPRVSKFAFKAKIEDLMRNVDLRNVVKPTELNIHMADPIDIKKLKVIGNRIISSITSEYRAWSLDFSKLFECYVQHVFTEVAKKIGARSFSNNKFSISGSRKTWTLSYLEPDIVLTKGNKMIVADAKYKMHMLNQGSEKVDTLKESFRSDLHQVLAYSSFEREMSKTAILVYPSTKFMSIHQKISVPFTSCCCSVFLVGIPWGDCTITHSTATIPISIQDKLNMAIEGLNDIIFKEL